MVFSHGFRSAQAMLRLLAPSYARRLNIIAFDLVGNGVSDLSAYERQNTHRCAATLATCWKSLKISPPIRSSSPAAR